MNGMVIADALRSRPPESLSLKPFPGTISPVADYFDAKQASEAIEAEIDDPEASTKWLTQYIFHRSSEHLDLVAAMTHRYQQADTFMSHYPNGHELLAGSILNHLQSVATRLQVGYVAMSTNTIISSTELVAGELSQRVYIPPVIQSRSLTWNHWAQDRIREGEVDSLFTDSTYRHGMKVASGALLPAGNLWVEVGEGLARLRWAPGPRDIEQQLGISETSEWDPIGDFWHKGFGRWFVMSHIAEKDILRLSESIRPGMIDSMKLTPAAYVQSYKPIIDLMDLNPQLAIEGILSDGSWIYSNELAQRFPDQHVSGLHDIAGQVVELGGAEEIGLAIQAMFATYDPKRHAAYESGDYKAGVAARFINREGMVSALSKFGINLTE